LSESNVSVIIITKNESSVIENCLTSIFNQSVKPLEVVVVDGRSTDDTVEKARRFPVKILEETGQTSPSNARNLGVQHANGEIVLILDADTELFHDCIRNALKYFDDPNVIVVIPSLEISIHTHLEEIQQKWLYGTRSRFRSGIGTGYSIQFIRKDVYIRVKFDSSIGYGDDGDFRRRLVKLYGESQRIIKAQDSKISVNLPHSFSEMASQYLWYGRTSLKYYIKYQYIAAFIRLGSLLMPPLLFISGILTFFLPSVIYLSILILILLIARNIIVCIRSRSTYFFEFVFFDFMRSFFYFLGLLQGFFFKKTGR